MFANCSLAGMDFGFPDVCLTPSPVGPIPVPYPNLAQLPMALPPTTSLRHLISMMPAHNLSTTIPMSLGDNAGVNGGVLSGTVMGPARNTVGSAKVFTGGPPATRLTSPALQNQSNCPAGMTLVPSQCKVLILS
jgi:hypothetical protein